MYDLQYNQFLKKPSQPDRICNPCFFRLKLKNSSEVTSRHLLLAQNRAFTKIYSGKTRIEPFFSRANNEIFLIDVEGNSTDTLLFEVYSDKGLAYNYRLSSDFEVYDRLENSYPTLFETKGFFTYGFYSILGIIMVLALSFFLYLRNFYFLFYAFYVAFILILFFINNVIYPYYWFFDFRFYIQLTWWFPFCQIGFLCFYLLFIMSVLETAKNHKFIHKLIMGSLAISLVYLILHTFLMLQDERAVGLQYFNYYRGGILLLGLIILVLFAFRLKKGGLVALIWTGSICLFIGSLLTFLSQQYFDNRMFNIWGPYFMQSGILLELMFFSLAVAAKTKHLANSNLEYQTRLSIALKTNLDLVKESEVKLKEKIEAARKTIERQEKARMQDQLELKERELEMQILRAQINPHFLFNCINAVKILIHNNDSKAALNYFEKFSRLLRLILENTFEKRVTLASELECLKLYVEFENLRLAHPVEFITTISKDMDTDFVMVPAMLLQPFVENAIWHGLSAAGREDGQINLTVEQDDWENLIIKVRDNGIGRMASQALQSGNPGKKSLGILITRQRLRLINQSTQNIRYKDLIDENGQACGTEVTVIIHA